ncbi:MAG: LysR family transcriptional regulator [Halothiobacillaceae bacterium]|nr:MAG: LysR family transcriptional regulator [Halothiobacillaceae bacterium]
MESIPQGNTKVEIQAYAAFLAVAELASFSLAAERLHLTQPAISKRIAQLEAALGASLFDRLGRRVALTEAGRALRPVAERILRDVRETRQVIANLSTEIGGPLSVVTSHHIGLRRLPPVLRDYTRHHPRVRLDLAFMDSEQACQAVERGEFELGIVTLPLRPAPALAITPLWDDPLVIAVAPDHPLATQGAVTLDDLGQHPAILPAVGTYTRTIIEATILQRHGALDVILETNYLETLRTMVAIGLGWSALPRQMVRGDVVEVPVEGLAIRRTLGIVRHAGRTVSHAAGALMDLLGEAADHP